MKQQFQFDAYHAYADLQARYSAFLLDTVGVRQGPLAQHLTRFWSTEGQASCLFAPLLVQGAFPYRPGKRLIELAGAKQTHDKPLHPKTVKLLVEAGIDYELFEHQVKAIRQAREGKTVVVAAGTGSGKTEAFLIPVIDRLIRDHEEHRDNLDEPGVRALVVYPLNALVNNQIDRLLSLLKAQEQITFAYYTSRLKDTFGEAKRYYERRPGGALPPKCQIVDRATLRGLDGGNDATGGARPKGPPHILVTNFSMLEYMLIRPTDRSIFSPHHLLFEDKSRLKMVVLDEAHVYVGAQAAEMHMLLRRAADRFGTNLASLQGFATSATLSTGMGKKSNALEEYACKMFEKTAAQVAVVVGDHEIPKPSVSPRASPPAFTDPEKLPPGDLVPPALRTLDFDAKGKPKALCVDPVLAKAAAQAAVTLGITAEADIEALSGTERETPALLLYTLFGSHPKLLELRQWLFDAEKDANRERKYPTLDEVAAFLYGEGSPSESRRRACEAVLRLGALARNAPDKHPLLPVRMHAFVRAPVGVMVDPRPSTEGTEPEWPWGKLHLLPAPEDEACPRLPLLVCATCGGAYLEVDKNVRGQYVPPKSTGGSYVLSACRESEGEGIQSLPEAWGGVKVRERTVWSPDRHGNRTIGSCAQCRTPRARLRTLRLSPRLALATMIDSVYPSLGEMSGAAPDLPGAGRRLMTFSDSRQEAARVAAQVERSHDIGLNRAMLRLALVTQAEGTEVSIKELCGDLKDDPLLRQRALALLLTEADALENLATLSVFEEFARPPAGRQNTLETLGLVEVVYPDLPTRPPQVHQLSDDEWKSFVATILDLARSSGCVMKPSFDSEQAQANELEELLPFIDRALVLKTAEPEDRDEEDDEEAASDESPHPVGLIATGDDGRCTRFMTFAQRVAQKVGANGNDLLQRVFESLQAKVQTRCKWLRSLGKGGLQIRLEHLSLKLRNAPPLLAPASGEIFFRAVRGEVPARSQAGGVRAPTAVELEGWKERHAIRRVLKDAPLGLWSLEHTAQIDVDDLEKEECAFRDGRRNLLASSTTMEMGVDIGGLTLVVLTNVPPGPANYWQRAGRAGRRADGSSMTVTLALVSAHDQLVFSDPRAFLQAPIDPPRVRLDAGPLLLRHVCGYLLSQFFQEVVLPGGSGNPMKSYGTVREFVFEPAANGITKERREDLGLDVLDPLWVGFSRWLSGLHPSSALADRVSALCRGTVLEGSPLDELAAQTIQLLEKAVREAAADREVLAQQRKEEAAKGEGSMDGLFLRALEYQESALLSETLISYLASKAFLPRFGFPLDVVRLNTRWKIKSRTENEKERKVEESLPDLRMERALDLALTEYAPGDEVIAGKRVFRSAGLQRNWFGGEEAMSRRYFFECLNCRHLDDGYVDRDKCPVCGHPAIPETEFLARKGEELRGRRRRRCRSAEDALEAADPGVPAPSGVRTYLRPAGFAVKLGRPPRRVSGEIARVGPTWSSLILEASKKHTEAISGALAVSFAPGSRIFVRSEGKPEASGRRGFGFLVCQVCGFAYPEAGWGAKVPAEFADHRLLRGVKKCPGETSYWRHAVLGTSLPIDALCLELSGELEPKLADQENEPFFVTLAAIAQLAASRCLQVDLRALSSGVASRKIPGGHTYDAVVYESATSGLLRQLAVDPGVLLKELRRLLESENQADFIRFDTQFLREKLRPDLVKAHFNAEHRKRLLEFTGESAGVRVLRGRSPRLAAIELLGDPALSVGMAADALATDAFESGDGLLRNVRCRAVNPAAKALPVRLLLSELPRSSGSPEEAFLASKLKRLIEDGVEVRRAGKEVAAKLAVFRWHVVGRKADDRLALGGIWAGERKEAVGSRFGSCWLDGAMPVEAEGVEAARAVETFDALWVASAEVAAKDLEPRAVERVSVLSVAQGSRIQAECDPRMLLNKALEADGGIAGVGQVTRLLYLDRYVAGSTLGLYLLKQLLAAFNYAPQAQGKVISLEPPPDVDHKPVLSSVNILSSRIFNLHQSNSASVRSWCVNQLGSKLKLAFDVSPSIDLPHPRKLLIEVAAGGRLKTLKVCFDHGLDWMRTESVKGPVVQGPFIAGETHIVVFRDQSLAGELGWSP
jgi:DEAD/DEAH box helicase domain-containing protein